LRVFLDADVLAASLTRTLIMVASTVGERVQFFPSWSLAVEVEADGHVKPGQARLSAIRPQLWGGDTLVPDVPANAGGLMRDTDIKDQHVLAAAFASGISLIVSRNVKHFGTVDLRRCGVDVAHPDLFLASRLTCDAYRGALSAICARRTRPPNTPEALHVALGREHPLLTGKMAGLFPACPAPATHDMPGVMFRGSRCLVCGQPLNDPESLRLGIGPECRWV